MCNSAQIGYQKRSRAESHRAAGKRQSTPQRNPFPASSAISRGVLEEAAAGAHLDGESVARVRAALANGLRR